MIRIIAHIIFYTFSIVVAFAQIKSEEILIKNNGIELRASQKKYPRNSNRLRLDSFYKVKLFFIVKRIKNVLSVRCSPLGDHSITPNQVF